ncbi:hypothetical protein C5167_006533, partial [Papaver somniferum]
MGFRKSWGSYRSHGIEFGKFVDEYIVRVVDVYAMPLGMTLCCERSWVKVQLALEMRVTKVVSSDLSGNPGDWYFLIRRSAIMFNMESKGKGVSIDGVHLPFEAGEIDFGEPDSNGQHNFYQLIHQGRVIPCDFIGVVKSQQPVYLKGATLTTIPLRVNVLSKGLSYKEITVKRWLTTAPGAPTTQ